MTCHGESCQQGRKPCTEGCHPGALLALRVVDIAQVDEKKDESVLCGVRLVGGETIFAIGSRDFARRYIPHFNEFTAPMRLELVDWLGSPEDHAESWKLHAKNVCATIGEPNPFA